MYTVLRGIIAYLTLNINCLCGVHGKFSLSKPRLQIAALANHKIHIVFARIHAKFVYVFILSNSKNNCSN